MYKKMSNQIKNIFFDKRFVLISILFSSLASFLVNPYARFQVTSFDRVMGNAMLNGLDVGKRISTFQFQLFIFIPIAFITIWALLSKYYKKNHNQEFVGIINAISIMGIINFVISYFDLMLKSYYLVVSYLALVLISVVIMIIEFITRKKKIPFQLSHLKWSLVAPFPLTLFITFLATRFHIGLFGLQMIFASIFTLSILLFYLISTHRKVNANALKKAYLGFMLSPIFVSIFVELYNVLNQYNIFIPNKIFFITLIYSTFALLSSILYIINYKKGNKDFDFEKYYFPIILISFVLISIQLPMVSYVNTDFFESSNHGAAIYALLKHGKLPIIQTYDAHMLYYQISGIIYGLLNHDINGALFMPYIVYGKIFFTLIMYILFKRVFNRDHAFLISLFFPLATDWGLGNFYLGFFSLFAILNAYKKKSYISYLLFWLSLVLVALLKLDVGYTIGIASILILAYLFVNNRESIDLKKLLFSLTSVLAFFGMLYLGLCFIKDVDPLSRLIEFLKLSMSNINWAYYSLGDPTKFNMFYCYFIIPTASIMSLIYYIYTTVKEKKPTSEITIILIFLVLTYIFNFSRGIVRHSLVENELKIMLSFSTLYFALYFSLRNKNKLLWFSALYLVFLIANGLIISPSNLNYSNLISSSTNHFLLFQEYNEQFTTKMNRVELSAEMKATYEPLKVLFNQLLNKDETYIDYSNQTLLYALLGYDKPVYVNQSPGLLSGEFTQQLFLKQIKERKNVNFVLTADSNNYLAGELDFIRNNYRYYLVSEHIFQNYRPLTKVNGFIIWVKNDLYESKKAVLQRTQNYVNYGKEEYITNDKSEYSLGYIPYIWGTYDKNVANYKLIKKIGSNLSVKKEKESVIFVDFSEINKKNGNYLKLTLKAKSEPIVTVILYDENNQVVSQYAFFAKPNTNHYVIRISTDYSWYVSNIKWIKIVAEDDLNNVQLSIFEGDVLNKDL